MEQVAVTDAPAPAEAATKTTAAAAEAEEAASEEAETKTKRRTIFGAQVRDSGFDEIPTKSQVFGFWGVGGKK